MRGKAGESGTHPGNVVGTVCTCSGRMAVFAIQAERRTATAGLGSVGSSYAGLYSAAGSYKDTLKQLTKARFNEIFQYQLSFSRKKYID